MKNSEITTEANKIINTVFHNLSKCEDRALWKRAIEASKQREYETGSFIWGRVVWLLLNKYSKKFIKND